MTDYTIAERYAHGEASIDELRMLRWLRVLRWMPRPNGCGKILNRILEACDD